MLLVTRPQPSAADTARALRKAGHVCRIAPALRASFIKPHAINAKPYQAILVTSGNAARALAKWPALHHLPAFAVGDTTQKILRASGFKKTHSADGDAVALAKLVRTKLDSKKGALLIACAPTTGKDLALRLKTFKTKRLPVYRVTAVASLPAAAAHFLRTAKAGDGVLFYSGRTAKAFMAAVKKARIKGCTKQLNAYCLSAAVAKAAQKTQWGRMITAAKPTEQALLALLPNATRKRSLVDDRTHRTKHSTRR